MLKSEILKEIFTESNIPIFWGEEEIYNKHITEWIMENNIKENIKEDIKEDIKENIKEDIKENESKYNFIVIKSPEKSINKRKKTVISKKAVKFWGLDKTTEMSFFDIRKKFMSYLREKKLCDNTGIKIEKRLAKILGLNEGYVKNSDLDKIVESFFI